MKCSGYNGSDIRYIRRYGTTGERAVTSYRKRRNATKFLPCQSSIYISVTLSPSRAPPSRALLSLLYNAFWIWGTRKAWVRLLSLVNVTNHYWVEYQLKAKSSPIKQAQVKGSLIAKFVFVVIDSTFVGRCAVVIGNIDSRLVPR
jgi:hypothetical protein